MQDNIAVLREWIAGSGNIVFFGGAGVSTESGIPDFRSTDGLYRQEYKYPPETILSHTFFEQNPEEFFPLFTAPSSSRTNRCSRMAAHRRLAELEREGKLRAVITQNIDGLHQAAGSKRVIELHGSIHRCPLRQMRQAPVPRRPSTPARACRAAPAAACSARRSCSMKSRSPSATSPMPVNFIRKADVLIVGGTSLAVYPAAGLLRYYEGRKLALVNMGATSYDESADLLIREKIGKVFSEV